MRPHIRGFAQGVSQTARKASSTVPFRVEPRLDPKPWGSRNLARFRIPLPPDTPIGEAVITSGDARVLDGPGRGSTLGALVTADPLGLAGRRGLEATTNHPIFPLLVKLIDAAENLSIQVHPDDQAARVTNRLGKTEAWHILSADRDAVLYLGLRPDVSIAELVARCQLGKPTSDCLRRIPAVPGTTVLVPAGTVHAIGAGVLIYEIQQPSDVTYRLDDWGRVDSEGRKRELHIDLGLRVIDVQSRPEVIPPVPVSLQGGRRLLAACRYFALEQLVLGTGEEEISAFVAPESPQVVTCLEGAVRVAARRTIIPLSLGESMVIPAACTGVRVRASVPSVLLRAWVPDLMQDIVQPARAMGVTADAITSLTGGLVDLGSYPRKT
jgi:mannose-6-phosphate isomerase